MTSARITVRVTPRSGKDSIESGAGGVLLVRVTAPPDEGKANAAVCKVVAGALGVPKSAVTVVRGHTARTKALEVTGLTQEQAEERLQSQS
jgi:uncharacterized protein (TIGR00251 family)